MAAESERLAVATAVPAAAVMVAVVFVETAEVVIGNVAADAPPGTHTEVGTVTLDTLLDSSTLKPSAGAGPVSVIVPVDAAPPTTVLGLMVR